MTKLLNFCRRILIIGPFRKQFRLMGSTGNFRNGSIWSHQSSMAASGGTSSFLSLYETDGVRRNRKDLIMSDDDPVWSQFALQRFI